MKNLIGREVCQLFCWERHKFVVSDDQFFPGHPYLLYFGPASIMDDLPSHSVRSGDTYDGNYARGQTFGAVGLYGDSHKQAVRMM